MPLCLCLYAIKPIWTSQWCKYGTSLLCVNALQSPDAYICVFLPSLDTILNIQIQSDYNSQDSGPEENLVQWLWEMSVQP